MEALDRRDNPATNYWQNVDSNYYNPANWSDGVPTSDDVLVFSPSSAPPIPGSPPPPPVSTGTTFPNTTSSFAGIKFENGYAGTVTFPADVSFNYYYQDCGATVQAANTTLTAITTFIWTGGAVNNSANTATYQLNGISAGQIGTDTTTLSSGSKFVLQKYGTVTVNSVVRQSGIVNLTNDRGVDVLEDCTLILQQVNFQMPPGGNKPAMNAMVLTKGKTYSDGGKLSSVKVDGGSLWLRKGGLEVTDKVPGTDWSVVMTPTGSPTVSINNRETLKVAHGFQMNCDDVALVTNIVAEGPQTATIEGKFRILAGEIILGAGKTGTELVDYAGLIVTEDAELWGGKFSPVINPYTGSECEYIETKKKLNIESAFTVYPWHFQFPNVQEPYHGDWHVLRSALGFTDGTNPTNGDPDNWDMYRSVNELDWVVAWIPL
ncbi:MAG: hypothetical protein ABGY75_15540 [Gemmataceae bacterium]